MGADKSLARPTSRTGSDAWYSCHHNSSHFTFPIFMHSWRNILTEDKVNVLLPPNRHTFRPPFPTLQAHTVADNIVYEKGKTQETIKIGVKKDVDNLHVLNI